jgi:glycosyltransferase involved in cell wall biosynthesis
VNEGPVVAQDETQVEPERATEQRPFLSVLIGAYKRRDFLGDAIQSVLNQSLNRKYYEVVVTKNFSDGQIDELIAREHVRLVPFDEASFGEMMDLQIRAARGKILVFLEDDDRFLPTKLESVRAEFEADPSLVYFHNERVNIDREGRRLARMRGGGRQLGTGSLRIAASSQLQWPIREFAYRMGDFNPSCISIRREALVPFLPLIQRVTAAPDYILFLSALASGGALVADSDVLTEYRVHASTSNPLSMGRARFSRRSERAVPDRALERLRAERRRWRDTTALGLEIARGTRATSLAESRFSRSTLDCYLLNRDWPSPSSGEIARAIGRDVALGIRFASAENLLQATWEALRKFAPEFAIEGYIGQLRQRSRRELEPAS